MDWWPELGLVTVAIICLILIALLLYNIITGDFSSFEKYLLILLTLIAFKPSNKGK